MRIQEAQNMWVRWILIRVLIRIRNTGWQNPNMSFPTNAQIPAFGRIIQKNCVKFSRLSLRFESWHRRTSSWVVEFFLLAEFRSELLRILGKYKLQSWRFLAGEICTLYKYREVEQNSALGRWVAKLLARLLAMAALWVRIQTLKNTKCSTFSKKWPTYSSSPKNVQKNSVFRPSTPFCGLKFGT